MANLDDYLVEGKTSNLQVKMPYKLMNDVKVEIRKRNLTWKEFLIALFKWYLDNSKKNFDESMGANKN